VQESRHATREIGVGEHCFALNTVGTKARQVGGQSLVRKHCRPYLQEHCWTWREDITRYGPISWLSSLVRSNCKAVMIQNGGNIGYKRVRGSGI
jgi:hypothetical protein